MAFLNFLLCLTYSLLNCHGEGVRVRENILVFEMFLFFCTKKMNNGHTESFNAFLSVHLQIPIISAEHLTSHKYLTQM